MGGRNSRWTCTLISTCGDSQGGGGFVAGRRGSDHNERPWASVGDRKEFEFLHESMDSTYEMSDHALDSPKHYDRLVEINSLLYNME